MNNQAKNLYERALETKLEFGTQHSKNAVSIKNAVIIKRNFSGKEIVCRKKDGTPFKKQGRRFTLVLTEELFSALCAEKGTCSYGIWAFDPENPDLKVYTVEVNIRMVPTNPDQPAPKCILYTKRNGKFNIKELNDLTIGILDEIYECDIERVDLVLNPYDKGKVGKFTLYLREIKFVQTQIEESDDYWKQFEIEDVTDENNPFVDADFEEN